ncbi:hypothetical protein [Streptomyces sp. NPDC094032]|uniref:hypothetical protein n=1 Tax=Streptomyces sp. NPDC094032 TaxID=3155308 RepID=UPI00332560B2
MKSPAHPEEAAARPGRVRAAWRAAHEPVAGVSRRTRLAAYGVVLAVLPSSLWRLPAAFDRGIGAGERVYVVFLSVLSEALALTFLWTLLTPATQITGRTIRGDALPADFPSEAGGWEAAWFYVCYSPLVLWGPLLAVLTVAYARRRRAAETTAATG